MTDQEVLGVLTGQVPVRSMPIAKRDPNCTKCQTQNRGWPCEEHARE